MNYQVKTVAPYWFKTVILRKKGLTSPTLYNFKTDSDSTMEDTSYPQGKEMVAEHV